MIAAVQIPPEVLAELERLAVLEATALLDSPPEETFDVFTRLASSIIGAPVALVSLVDRDRQYFKSCHGLREPWATTRESPLSHSFCRHVVESSDALIVSDARTHPLLRENLAIPEMGVIAYLGIPLTTPEGQTLGSFCVIDRKPREWTDREIEILRDLAGLVMAKIQVRLLARRFQADYLEMRQLQLHRDEMVQMLIHDLRTPLTAFLGGLELTQRAGVLTGKHAEFLALAHRGGAMLLEMINGILDVSKTQSTAIAIKMKDVDTRKFVQSVCAQVEPLAENARVHLSHDVTAELVRGDREKLHRVLVNLVGNAIQHTPVEGTVRVSVHPDPEGGVRFSVSDTGIGIPLEAREQIFQKYGAMKGRRISGQSTGLGLPFSRMVVESHGGRIWLESELGRGTTFHFTIPVRAEPESR